MSILEEDVERLLCEALPEFSATVHTHRKDWQAEPMLYVLLGTIFNEMVCLAQSDGDWRDIVRRAYQLTERAISDGAPRVRDLFAIEMIEPFAGDPDHKFYPNFEELMGPSSLLELASMREWGRRYQAMTRVIGEANRIFGKAVLKIAAPEGNSVRVIADVEQWDRATAEQRAGAVLLLTRKWRELCAPEDSKSTVEVTGPRETGFRILWES